MKKKLLVAIAVSVPVFVLTLVLYLSGTLDRLEYFFSDEFAKIYRIDKKSSDKVKVVLIDEASLKAMEPALGRWPWPRAIWSELIEFLNMGGANTVVFDILFTERQKGINDNTLVKATKSSGNVHHSMMVLHEQETEDIKAELNKKMPADFVERFSVKNINGTPAFDKNKLNNNFYLPFADLYKASESINVVEFSPDKDGVFRRSRPFREYQGSYFSVHGLAPFKGKDTKIVSSPNMIKIGDKSIPLDKNGNIIINMYGNVETYSIGGIFSSLQKIRIGDIENILVNPEEFKDSIVYVGASAVGVEDLKSTPIAPRLPGVMLHVSLASNYILDDFITPPDRTITIISIILGAFLTIFLILYTNNYIWRIAFPTVMLVVYISFAVVSFKLNNLVEIVPFIFSTLTGTFITLGYLTYTEAMQKKKVSHLFTQYVSKEVLNEIMTNYKEFMKSGLGMKEEITVLFSDIRGFTTLSEKNPPEKVVDMLNTHFTHMAEIILNQKGTLDKYIGDAIMAFWGAPIHLEDHAYYAVQASIMMLNELKEVNRVLKEKGHDYEIKIGVGLNTGIATIGNIGSERKLNYTVVGDTVNLASRLEGLTKDFGSSLIISEYTYEKVKDRIPCKLLGNVKVKGREKLVDIYAPLAVIEKQS